MWFSNNFSLLNKCLCYVCLNTTRVNFQRWYPIKDADVLLNLSRAINISPVTRVYLLKLGPEDVRGACITTNSFSTDWPHCERNRGILSPHVPTFNHDVFNRTTYTYLTTIVLYILETGMREAIFAKYRT